LTEDRHEKIFPNVKTRLWFCWLKNENKTKYLRELLPAPLSASLFSSIEGLALPSLLVCEVSCCCCVKLLVALKKASLSSIVRGGSSPLNAILTWSFESCIVFGRSCKRSLAAILRGVSCCPPLEGEEDNGCCCCLGESCDEDSLGETVALCCCLASSCDDDLFLLNNLLYREDTVELAFEALEEGGGGDEGAGVALLLPLFKDEEPDATEGAAVVATWESTGGC